MRPWIMGACAALLLVPAGAQAAAPTCNDMNVGVPHNAVTPIFIDCSGGTGAGSPDVLISTNPTKGTLNPSANGTSTDQWVVYTPSPGQSGADSFTYRGYSPGSGAGGSDEIGPVRTVNIRIGAGSPPVCANQSQSVPQATSTFLRLVCASGGDPIVSFAISDAPDHGALGTTNLNGGLVSYTSSAGYAGQDFFGYRATSTCGAASCQSPQAIFDLQVLNPQQGPPGSTGPQGSTGPAGQDGAPGAPGSVVTVDRLFIASFLDSITVRRGKPVILRYVSTTGARVVLEVIKGSRRVAAVPGNARAGKNAIRWNGKVDRKKAPRGTYKLRLTATAGQQVAKDRATVRLR
jgi:Big-like domain-containing protein